MILDSPYLTTSEVGQIIRMDAEYVARMCKAGKMRGTQLGRTWRIHRDEVDRFMSAAGRKNARVREPRRRAS